MKSSLWRWEDETAGKWRVISHREPWIWLLVLPEYLTLNILRMSILLTNSTIVLQSIIFGLVKGSLIVTFWRRGVDCSFHDNWNENAFLISEE